MSTVYGPVPSWRLGRSLGIDVLLPPKKCTFNCIYCQLGRTKFYISGPEMISEPLVDAERVVGDLRRFLRRLDINTIDFVTFSGTGEPTLNLKLGEIARIVRDEIEGKVPLAILTNSSLFHRRDVVENLSNFDLVVAKLDAGDNQTFRAINRPADRELNIETIVESIKRLKKSIKGMVALEVMLIMSEDGKITNVEGKPFKNLLEKIFEIEPDQVQLETPYRPPSESFVKSPSMKRLKVIFKEVSQVLGEDRVLARGIRDRFGRRARWLSHKSLEDEVAELLKRRPCRAIDVSISLGINLPTAQKLLEEMLKRYSSSMKMKIFGGEIFYSYKEGGLT